MPVANSASASGLASAASALGKSRPPDGITVLPGRNLRVAGLGVFSISISMGAMWPSAGGRSTPERRRPRDQPARKADGDRQAEQSRPPAAALHWLDARVGFALAGDH